MCCVVLKQLETLKSGVLKIENNIDNERIRIVFRTSTRTDKKEQD